MEIPLSLGDIGDLLGKSIYRLSAFEKKSFEKDHYAYQIRASEFKIVEIRFGESRRESDKDFYGPGFVSLLCKSENGYLQAFSPVGDEILSNNTLAGRQVRGFLYKEDLLQEAETLKECVFKNYKRVAKVEICLDDFLLSDVKPSLSEKIQSASTRVLESRPTDKSQVKDSNFAR